VGTNILLIAIFGISIVGIVLKRRKPAEIEEKPEDKPETQT
jgi:hypothetical protein